MRGLCKTSCGCEIEFEPHEFSDGFVYYLPRNLDHTPHQCVIFNAVEECYQDPDPDMEEFYQENKTRLKITQEKFNELINDASGDPVSFMDSFFDTDNMDMLRKGKMFELKKYIENNLNVLSNPFFMSRAPDNGTGQNAPVEMSIFSSKVNVEELLNFIPLILPTGLGYQLEYLGHAYELMIRLEDAKKCYQLQYECTGESELLEKLKELDKKIKEQNETKTSIENIPDNITPELLKNSIDETEKKIRQYIIALFSNDVNKIWKRLPNLGQTIHRIHEKEQESILIPNEKSDVERLSLGMLNKILKESKSKIYSNKNGKCSICGKTWKRGDYIYLGKHKVKDTENPICSDEDCFKKQGGLVSITPYALINNIYIITDARNVISHIRDYDKIMQQIVFTQAFHTCPIINNVIDDYLDKKNLI